MDHYVTTDFCERAKKMLNGRMKWLACLLIVVLGVTGLTAEEAWRARNGFDQINSGLERRAGISETQVKGIQRSLDRIDRRLEQQEAVLHRLLRANHLNEP